MTSRPLIMPKRSHFKHRTEEEIAARTASGARSVHVLYIPENTEKAGAMGHLFSNGSSEKRTHHTSISPRDHGLVAISSSTIDGPAGAVRQDVGELEHWSLTHKRQGGQAPFVPPT